MPRGQLHGHKWFQQPVAIPELVTMFQPITRPPAKRRQARRRACRSWRQARRSAGAAAGSGAFLASLCFSLTSTSIPTFPLLSLSISQLAASSGHLSPLLFCKRLISCTLPPSFPHFPSPSRLHSLSLSCLFLLCTPVSFPLPPTRLLARGGNLRIHPRGNGKEGPGPLRRD